MEIRRNNERGGEETRIEEKRLEMRTAVKEREKGENVEL